MTQRYNCFINFKISLMWATKLKAKAKLNLLNEISRMLIRDGVWMSYHFRLADIDNINV